MTDAGIVHVFVQDAKQKWSLVTSVCNPPPERADAQFGAALDRRRAPGGLLIYVGAPVTSRPGIPLSQRGFGALDAKQMPEEILVGLPGCDSISALGAEKGDHFDDVATDVHDRIRLFAEGFE